MMNFTNSGKIDLLKLLKDADLYLAWGIGDPAWDTGGTPAFADTATGLVSELGRRRVMNKQWVVPDVGGTIIVNGVNYSLSSDAAPTRYLYCSVTFDPTEEPTANIREYGLFEGTTVNATLAGQMYFVPADVIDPGTLILGQNFAKIVRSAITHENFYFIVQL